MDETTGSSLHRLHAMIDMELDEVGVIAPDDPETVRYEVGLRGMRHAVEVLEDLEDPGTSAEQDQLDDGGAR